MNYDNRRQPYKCHVGADCVENVNRIVMNIVCLIYGIHNGAKLGRKRMNR